MKKLIPSLIITFLILFPPTLHAQTFSSGGFGKGGFRSGGFTRAGGISKISGFRGGFSNSAAISKTSGMGSKNGNSKGFARSNFNRRGFGPNLSNKPNATFSNNTPYIKRQSINTGISNHKVQNLNNAQDGLFKTVRNESKNINPNLLTKAGDLRSNSLKNGGNKSRLTSRGLNLNNSRISNIRNANVSPNSLINRVPPKKEISSIQTDLSATPSRNTEIRQWVDDGVLHFTNRVCSLPNGEKTVNVINGNNSVPVSRDLNVDRNLSTSGALTNSLSTDSKNPVRLSMKQNTNSSHSNNGFVDDNIHVSTNNVFNFSFNFFFPSPFFFQPFFFPAFFDPFVFSPLFPSPFFTFTPLIPAPVFNPFLFQQFFVSPFFNPFPFSMVFFINTVVSNDVIID